jgi:hypothetical protein
MEIPSSKLPAFAKATAGRQVPKKFQVPNINWSLRFGASLEFGTWILEFHGIKV